MLTRVHPREELGEEYPALKAREAAECCRLGAAAVESLVCEEIEVMPYSRPLRLLRIKVAALSEDGFEIE